ncbi:MAG: MlaE family ABC transporter permease [Thermodesulfobacteriota bacterium]
MGKPSKYTLSSTSTGILQLSLRGSWTVDAGVPDFGEVLAELDNRTRRIFFETSALESWDSVLPVFLNRFLPVLEERKVEVDLEGLPGGVRKLLRLAEENRGKKRVEVESPADLASKLGNYTLAGFKQIGEMAVFSLDLGRDFTRLLLGRTYFRPRDLLYFIQNCGASALPIVSLIAILVGVILAFIGAIQLEMFGAQIYVANLVGIAMLLEMGAVITGIVMAGRTGASYAAQLGTMEVNEEIDALKTMGVSPLAFLVIPRMLALILMLPLLCIYADFLGILGGGLIGVGMLDLSFTEYFIQTREALNLRQFGEGVFKSLIFAFLVGFAGCFYGIHCGRSAAAVGRAATSAVVAAIVMIVIADAIMVVVFNLL